MDERSNVIGTSERPPRPRAAHDPERVSPCTGWYAGRYAPASGGWCGKPAPHGFCDECAKKKRAHLLGPALDSIGAAFDDDTFDAPQLATWVKVPGAIELARAAVDHPFGATLIGPAGRGKTTLAVCMLRERLRRAMDLDLPDWEANKIASSRFMSSFALASCRSTNSSFSEPEILTAALDSAVLVIDELGTEDKFHNSPIVEVLNTRHRRKRPTIVTSGYPKPYLLERYGAGSLRRLFEQMAEIQMGVFKR